MTSDVETPAPQHKLDPMSQPRLPTPTLDFAVLGHRFPAIAGLIILAALLLPVGASGPASAASLAEPPVIDDEARTTWRQVTWEDFKGRWRKLSRLTNEGAYIATGIQLADWQTRPEPTGDGTWVAEPQGLAVYSFMEKYMSSYQPGSNTDYALAHEQGHFDLSELVARRLALRLVGVTGRGDSPGAAAEDLQRKVDQRFSAALEELDRLQSSYDGETRHGGRKNAQRKWWKEIPEMLEEARRQLEAALETP